jgi:hypothetical protein
VVGRPYKLYVEGGGQSKALKTACRSGFSRFLEKTGLTGRMPRIVACGSRQNAYDSFCTALQNGESALLLIDSEAEISQRYQQDIPDRWLPWHHLKSRQGDGWNKPDAAGNADCHLMVQCMEAWFCGYCSGAIRSSTNPPRRSKPASPPSLNGTRPTIPPSAPQCNPIYPTNNICSRNCPKPSNVLSGSWPRSWGSVWAS